MKLLNDDICKVNTYLVFDLETSGFRAVEGDVVTQLGWAIVQNNKCTEIGSYYIKRPAGTMLKNGEASEASTITGITDEILQEKGEDPRKLLDFAKYINDWTAAGGQLIGHNIFGFDIPFLQDEMRIEFDFKLDVPISSVIDTGMMVKASQLKDYQATDETRQSFYRRVRNMRSRVKWNLSDSLTDLCGKDALEKIAGDAHDAGTDCEMVVVLFKKLQELVDV